MPVNPKKPYAISQGSLTPFIRNLRRRLRLGKREFNICFVDDKTIRHLNKVFRGRNKATDVLSFRWAEDEGSSPGEGSPPGRARRSREERKDFTNFLGDIVISVEAARRNAVEEGHSTLNEIRWLVLHGVLHLLGYDHEHDAGEMTELELKLREQLGVLGGAPRIKQVKSQRSKGKRQKFKRPRL